MKQSNQGFSLLEMLLVLIIISTIVYLGIGYVQQRTLATQVDRTAQQMEQVLTAGLSYYVANGRWPGDLATLKSGGYLPTSFQKSPWTTDYIVKNTTSNFYVMTNVLAANRSMQDSYARLVAGRLPLSYTAVSTSDSPPAQSSCTDSDTCYVVATVNIPGQNLNNARGVNFAGVYHHGACVPVPECPVDSKGNTMTPEVFVVPLKVSGIYDQNNNNNVYPISSFTAYSTGGTGPNPPACTNQSGGVYPGDATNFSCVAYAASPPDYAGYLGGGPYNFGSKFWRACLDITTEKGNVNANRRANVNDLWGNQVTMAAFTRCGVSGEPTGSTFNMYGN